MKPDLSESNLTFYDIAYLAKILSATDYNRISINLKSLYNEMENSNLPYLRTLNTCNTLYAAHCFMMFNKAHL